MRLPILSGVYRSDTGFRQSLPVNLSPHVLQDGISEGFLAPFPGITQAGETYGPDRGGFVFNDRHIRVSGPYVVEINPDGSSRQLGNIGGMDRIQAAQGFDRAAILSNGTITYLLSDLSLVRADDELLTGLRSITWQGGHFIANDDQFILVTSLVDPTSVPDSFSFGSAEVSPDPIVSMITLRNEVYALGRHTIEVFSANGAIRTFPYSRIPGAQVQRGCVGSHAATIFGSDAIAFIGGGAGEAVSIWLTAGGNAQRLATREIDLILQSYTAEDLATASLQERISDGQALLFVHLPRHTLAYDAAASAAMQMPVWFRLSSSPDGDGAWQARDIVLAHDAWWVGDPDSARIGKLDESDHRHWAEHVGFEIQTAFVYNKGAGFDVSEMELVAATGDASAHDDATISMDYSDDGRTFSRPATTSAGGRADRRRRLRWLRIGVARQRRLFRFRWNSRAPLAPSRLDLMGKPCAW